MRAAPAAIGGMPRSSKRASERQSATSSRSPCTTWIAIAVWPSLKVVNSCALRRRDGGCCAAMIRSTRPPMVSRPSDSGITSSSSRSPSRCVAGEHVGLDRRAERHDLVGSRLVSGARPKNSRDRAPHLRHARRAADQHDALDVVGLSSLGVAQRLAHGGHACGRRSGRAIASKSARVDVQLDELAADSWHANVACVVRRQRFLGRARGHQQRRACRAARRRAAPACVERPVGQRGGRSRRRRAPSRRRWRPPRTRRASGAGSRCRRCRRRGRRPRRGLRCALSRP